MLLSSLQSRRKFSRREMHGSFACFPPAPATRDLCIACFRRSNRAGSLAGEKCMGPSLASLPRLRRRTYALLLSSLQSRRKFSRREMHGSFACFPPAPATKDLCIACFHRSNRAESLAGEECTGPSLASLPLREGLATRDLCIAFVAPSRRKFNRRGMHGSFACFPPAPRDGRPRSG